MLEIKGNMGQCKSAPRTLYIGFRKAKVKKSYREHGTVQSKDQDFKRDYAKEKAKRKHGTEQV
jgi:hypothetical protein